MIWSPFCSYLRSLGDCPLLCLSSHGISAPSLSPQGEFTPGAFGPGMCVTGVSAPRLVVPITMAVVPVGVFVATTANASKPQASQFVHISRGYRTSRLKPLHNRGSRWNQPSLLRNHEPAISS